MSLKDEFRLYSDPLDKWAFALGMWFEIAEELDYRGVKVPKEWDYEAGLVSLSSDFQFIHDEGKEELIHFGNVLCRLVRHYGRVEGVRRG